MPRPFGEGGGGAAAESKVTRGKLEVATYGTLPTYLLTSTLCVRSHDFGSLPRYLQVGRHFRENSLFCLFSS